MAKPWVCIDCGARQADKGACAACGKGDTLDTRDEKVRELMYDVDLRLRQKAETRARMIGVAIGMGTIGACMVLVPGYWKLRGRLYPGLPGLIDQWFFMAVIGFFASKLLERVLLMQRFPYLNEQQQIVD